MPRSARLGLVFGLFAMAVGATVFGSMAYLRRNPPNVNYVSGHSAGQPVHLTIQTVGTMGHGRHPTWVSYLAKAPDGKWVHSTLWQLPAHTKVDVTLYEYDGATPLRNAVYGKVTGVGNTYTVNGNHVSLVRATSTKIGVAHTFSVPRMGINVPLVAVPASAQNTCSVAPCHRSSAHQVIKFSFNTGSSGQYRWQCFIPCGASWIDGNGGPMQTIGYMGGFLKVIGS